MKLLFVSQYFYLESFPVNAFAVELAKRGHEVHVVTGFPDYLACPGSIVSKEETYQGIAIHRLKVHKRKKGVLSLLRNYLSFWRSANRYFHGHKEDYDAIIGFNFSPIVSLDGVGKFAKRKKIPFLIYVFDLWPESVLFTGMAKEGSFLHKRLLSLSKKIYERADALLYSTPSFSDYFHKTLHIERPELDLYQIVEAPQDTHAPSPYKEGEKALLYAGNIGKAQNLDSLLRAFLKLDSSSPYRLYLIGEGSVKKRLQEEASNDPRVTFLPKMDPSSLLAYQKGAFLNLISLKGGNSPVSKTIPNRVFASLALGAPILASIDGDGKKVLEEAGGSLFFDEENLGEVLSKGLTLSKEELRQMGEKNREYFERNFRKEILVDRFESFLKEEVLLKRK